MNKKSFTILELIIFLAVFSILVTYALIRSGKQADKSAGIAEEATIKALRVSVIAYDVVHDRWPDWVEPDNPFSLLESAPSGWIFQRHEDTQSNYWWIRCPHNKIWWIYVLKSCKIHRDCAEDPNEIYVAGRIVRCKKTPLSHDYVDTP